MGYICQISVLVFLFGWNMRQNRVVKEDISNIFNNLNNINYLVTGDRFCMCSDKNISLYKKIKLIYYSKYCPWVVITFFPLSQDNSNFLFSIQKGQGLYGKVEVKILSIPSIIFKEKFYCFSQRVDYGFWSVRNKEIWFHTGLYSSVIVWTNNSETLFSISVIFSVVTNRNRVFLKYLNWIIVLCDYIRYRYFRPENCNNVKCHHYWFFF